MKLYVTVSVAALTLGLAACDSFPQPQYPVAHQGSQPAAAQAYAPDPAPQPQPQAQAQPVAPQDNGVQAKPTTGIQQSTLPPPPGAKTAPARKSSGASSGLDPSPYLMDAVWQREDGARLWLAAVHHKKKAAPAPEEKTETVVVGKGDTLASIARTDNTTVEALAKANGLKKPYHLTAGQTIKLPGGPSEDAASDTPAPKAKKGAKAAPEKPAASRDVKVGKGDTLASISKKTGVSIDDLASANGLKSPYRLKQGQTLKLSGEAEEAPASKSSKGKAKAPARDEVGEIAQDSGASTITVRRKDTIQSLAKQAHMSVAELARLNHLRKPYRLKPGQQIKLPDNPAPSSGRGSSSRSEEAAPARPRSVTVGRHDTLQSLAQKEGVSVETLAKLNHLKKPYRVKRGQTLRLPAQEAAEAPQSRTPTNYTIKSGDTLYSLARKFGTTPKALAEANGMEAGARLTVGRRIHVPGAETEERAAPSRPRVTSRVAPSEEPAQPVPYNALPSNPPVSSAPGLAPPPVLPPPTSSTPNPPYPVTPTPRDSNAAPYRPTPPAVEATPPGDAEVAALGKGLFQWPVKGDILQRFGALTGGQHSDGVDISAASGTPVVAAAAGEVVYAGSSVPGFGNMVLIRHDNGWVTVYAHLASLDVKMRQTVSQGQGIGAVGQSGGVSQPQLHFEVRYAPNAKDKARTIDPLLVLPQ